MREKDFAPLHWRKGDRAVIGKDIVEVLHSWPELALVKYEDGKVVPVTRDELDLVPLPPETEVQP